MGLIQPHYRISSYNQLAGLRIASGWFSLVTFHFALSFL
jgi:hypothetical protein